MDSLQPSAGQPLPQPAPLVLIVDDDPTLLEMYSDFLKANELNIETATDATSALTKIRQLHPTVVLLDIMLPGMNGLQVLEQIKKDPATASIKVVMFTALIQELEKQQAVSGGADDYMVKSEASLHDVLNRIRQLLNPTASPSVNAEATAGTATPPAPNSPAQ